MPEVVLEKRLIVPGTDGIVWGTLDCGVYNGLRRELHVVDLKFGKGHLVDPEGPQLQLYALALAQHFDVWDCKVTLTICQPRIGDTPLRSHHTTVPELLEWLADVVRPAVFRIKAGDATETAGAHCRWCVRKTECKAFANKHQTHAASAFDDGGPPHERCTEGARTAARDTRGQACQAPRQAQDTSGPRAAAPGKS